MSAMAFLSGIACWGGASPTPSVAAKMARAAGSGRRRLFDRVVQCDGAILIESRLRPHADEGTRSRREKKSGSGDTECPSVSVVADARLDQVDGESLPADPEGIGSRALLTEAYVRWGGGIAERLVGDYAFVLWDQDERRLVAARDPMGMRPLYYVRDGSRLLFASRIEQLLAAGVEASLFEPAVAAYLAGPWGRMDWTFLREVEQLPPGKVLIAEDGRVRVVDGFSLVPPSNARFRGHSEVERRFRDLFLQAVEDRAADGARTGLFLSSGTDSGAMASAAGWLRENGRIRGELAAYSFAFRRFSDCDERSVSRHITERYGIDERDVPGDGAWPLSGLDAYTPDMADPFFSPHHPLFAGGVELAARDGTDTMFMGNRGDEIVGDAITDLPGLARSLRLMALLREIHALGGRRPRRWLRVIRRDLFGTWSARHVAHGNPFDFTPQIPPWIRGDFARRVALEDILEDQEAEWSFPEVPRERRYRRITMFAGHRITGWLTRMHREHGLEFVDPWSDVRLARFILSIPQHLVNRAAEPKRIVSRALRGIYPRPALSRARKVIPGSLFDFGIKRGGRDIVDDLLTDSQAEARGFMDAAEVRRAWEEYVTTGRAPFDFWWPLTLEHWLRAHWS